MKTLFLVEDGMNGFLEAYKNCEENKIKLVFGLRTTVCEDAEDKSKESLDKECKYIILAKNQEGYKKLIKISSAASCDGFYYQPRTDLKTIAKHWSEKDLQLCVPFYDSFLFITLGCFGIAEIGKIFGNKGSAPSEEPAPEPEEPKERPGININIDGDDW